MHTLTRRLPYKRTRVVYVFAIVVAVVYLLLSVCPHVDKLTNSRPVLLAIVFNHIFSDIIFPFFIQWLYVAWLMRGVVCSVVEYFFL